MRPYLAIIRDSFREALASRVLWILLLLISVVLIGLAPLGYQAQLPGPFTRSDLLDAEQLVEQIRRDAEQPQPSPGKRIWQLWPASVQTQLGQTESGETGNERREDFQQLSQVRDALNSLIPRRDLYQEDAWRGVLLDGSTRELLAGERDALSDEQLAHLNRRLIEAAFPTSFQPRAAEAVVVTYAGYEVSPQIPFSKQRIDDMVQQFVLPALMGLLVGTIAVLAAILVTAPIIPQMFEPGSLHLLLSKPISRSLLFLAKFVGGCAFILLNVSYLIVGLWLIAGLRFGIWNAGLLQCIPIFLFLFTIYYSVSALAGLVFRSAILAVVITVVFWLACFSVGSAKQVIEAAFFDTRRLVHLVDAGETVISVDENGTTLAWAENDQQWEQVFLPPRGPMMSLVGPVYQAEHRRIAAGYGWRSGLTGSIPRRARLATATAANGWQAVEGPALPSGFLDLYAPADQPLLFVTTSGLFRLTEESGVSEGGMKVFGIRIPLGQDQPFERLGAELSPPLGLPAAVAFDWQNDAVAMYGQGRLLLAVADAQNNYQLAAEADLEDLEQAPALLGLSGQRLLVGLGDGRLITFSTADFTPQQTWQPESHSQPRFIRASRDGRWFAVVFQNRKLYLLDARTGRLQLADVAGQGDITAANFTVDGQLLVADQVRRVSRYETGSWKLTQRYAPPTTVLERVYRYGVHPVYTLFPKPGELGNTVQYVLTGEDTAEADLQGSLQAARRQLHPWRPVWSSLAFVIVMLTIGCVYVERQEF